MSSDLLHSDGRADDEAAQWFTRLNARSITSADLEAFRVWRRDSANDAAYRAVERVWRQSGALHRDPDIDRALTQARSVSPARPRPWWLNPGWVAGLGAVGAAAAVGIFVVSLPADQVYRTGVGEQRTVALADGSHVRLDTDSQIKVRFSANIRHIDLVRGQALFDVVHLSDRPLEVAAGRTVIRDLGTRFDVRRDPSATRVTVVEGAVHVDAGGAAQSWTLKGGQQVVVGSRTTAPHAVDAVRATSWTTGRLIFEDVALSDATAEMNRYGQHKLVLKAGAVGAIRVNGAFEGADTQAFVGAVTRLYDLKAEPQPDGSILLTADGLERPG